MFRYNKKLNSKFQKFVCLCLPLSTIVVSGCNGSSGGSSSSNSSGGGNTITRSLTDFTSGVESIPVVNYGTCEKVSRDTTSCQIDRENLGLTGNWLKFSCNVILGLADSSYAATTKYSNATYVSVTTADLPDYDSNYFPSTGSYSFTANGYSVTGTMGSMKSSYVPVEVIPANLAQQRTTLYIPINPSPAAPKSQVMSLGTVGVAINGVEIYDSVAGKTDNIYKEVDAFDTCQGHPGSGSYYHYHSEPYSISYQDSNLVGVMRDGYWIYGRYLSGTTTSLNDTNPASNAYIYGGDINSSTGQFQYYTTQATACVHESADGESYSDNGNSTCSLGTGGTLRTLWFLTGQGNGGVFGTVPKTTVDGAPIINNTVAVRYYYGTPAKCTGCGS